VLLVTLQSAQADPNPKPYWTTIVNIRDDVDFMNSSINRALIFQGGGSLGAYEAGAYKAISEELSAYFRTVDRGNEPIFHIISGTSIGAINAALLVSYVKENKHGKDQAKGLSNFSGESARRYFSTKEFIFKGVPNVFIPKTTLPDNRFFDPSNTWYIYDNRPLKETLEKFARFPISTSFEINEPVIGIPIMA
jgi:NTE family protein